MVWDISKHCADTTGWDNWPIVGDTRQGCLDLIRWDAAASNKAFAPRAGATVPPPKHIRIGFRLKEFPDVHLSIYAGPANPHASEGNTFKYQLDKALNGPDRERCLTLKFLRKGLRDIHDWQGGFEALTRTPEEEQSRSHHDFVLDF